MGVSLLNLGSMYLRFCGKFQGLVKTPNLIIQ